jgi:hypothetical protein
VGGLTEDRNEKDQAYILRNGSGNQLPDMELSSSEGQRYPPSPGSERFLHTQRISVNDTVTSRGRQFGMLSASELHSLHDTVKLLFGLRAPLTDTTQCIEANKGGYFIDIAGYQLRGDIWEQSLT